MEITEKKSEREYVLVSQKKKGIMSWVWQHHRPVSWASRQEKRI